MQARNWPSWCLLPFLLVAVKGGDDDYNIVHRDGSFQFGYETPDSYHHADANRRNVVKGEFGSRNPATGGIDSTVYTAGPRGFRPRGKNVVRKYDLNQNGPRPIGSPDDPYYDPFEDPSYNFAFRTRTYNREESANRVGDVNGKYSYVDDVGERHNVEFIAGKNTGFHVKTPYPDSNPRALGPLYFRGRGKPIPRGRTSIQRGLDGSYRFVSAGPDQRRTETSDSTGHVRGSYTYLDDKGVQHSVHYIAGPETGYRVLKNVKGPHLPTVFPFGRPDIIPSDFYDYIKDTPDVFDTAETGAIKPSKPGGAPPNLGSDLDVNDNFGKPGTGNKRPGGGVAKPNYDEEGSDSDNFEGDLFGGSSGSGPRPTPVGSPSTTTSGGSYIPPPGGDDGSYKPDSDDGSYKPGPDETGLGGDDGGVPKPIGGRPPRPPPRPAKPSYSDYDDGNDVGDNFGLFGSETNSRPPFGGSNGGNIGGGSSGGTIGGGSSGGTGGRPIIQITGQQGGGGSSGGCSQCKGTIVTNVGDKLFSVPPGVSVRAHVQAIDLLPLASKIPSPSEQYDADMSVKTEQLNSAASDQVDNTTPAESVKVTTTTAATTTTTTAPPPPSTTISDTTEDPDDTTIF